MTLVEGRHLTMTRRFEASPERLFDAWTDPNLAARWLFTGPASEAHCAELDVRVGGRWVIEDRRGGVDYKALGEYLEVERPRRLTFTFGMPQFSPAFDKVTVEIAPDGTGSVMTFTQEGLPADYIDATRHGWNEMFDALSARLVQGGYGVKLDAHSLRFERLFPGPIERLWAYLTDSEKRGQWFASGPMELRAGGKLALEFHHSALSPTRVDPPPRYEAMKDGVAFEGRVIACEPPRVLAFRWGEAEGADEAHFELIPEGDQVRLVLIHTKLKSAADMANVAAGWHTHLAILTDRTSGRAPTPFWSMWKGVEEEYTARLAKH